MATYEEQSKKIFLQNLEKNGNVTVDPTVRYGNHFDEKVFPYQVKLEADQKCVKPIISVYGGDIDKCIDQAWKAYDRIKEQGSKRGVPVAPLTKLGDQE